MTVRSERRPRVQETRAARKSRADRPAAQAGRVSEGIRTLATIGADGDGGVTRLGFSDDERRAHALVAGWLRDAGLDVTQDAVGNTIGERPGSRSDLPAIAVGSHLDSVPHGGHFDGIAGVVGAIEMVRVMAANDIETLHPVRVVCFVGEEGARFGEPCLGSRAAMGVLKRQDLARLRDATGVTLATAMADVGIAPNRLSTAIWDPSDWAAFLELHIEQGRVLQEGGRTIGVVDVVSGSTRLRLSIHGRSSHSGGTPMRLRVDALAAGAEVIVGAEAIAGDQRYRGSRVTVGYVEVYPNSITTIPGRVTLIVDVRDVDSDRQRQIARDVVIHARAVCERRGAHLEVDVVADTSPAVLPAWIRVFTESACQELGIEYVVLASGASHDAQIVNQRIPSGLIFVPSRDGLSHVPEEWSSSADIAAGVDVLTSAVLKLDQFLAANPSTLAGPT